MSKEETIRGDAPKPEVIVQQAPSNGLGTAGFIVSLLGLFLTCGVLSPVGLLFSGIAVFRKPRGMAFAGTVLGAIGTCWLLVAGGLVMVAVIGGASVYQTGTAIVEATVKIEKYREETGVYPEYMVGNELLEGVHDGWNNRVRYHLEEGAAVLTSAGPDGEFDTNDDISNHNAGGEAGGMFAQLNEALGKMNEPADSEMSGLLEGALGGQGLPGAAGDTGMPSGPTGFDAFDAPEPPGGF